MSAAATPSLQKFKTQVTDLGPAACLPRALTNAWLPAVEQSMQTLLNGAEAGGEIAIAAVFAVLEGKGISRAKIIHDDALRESVFKDYFTELGLEIVHRATQVSYEAATLETIFTKRDVEVWRKLITN